MELSAEAELGQLEALVTTHEAQFIKGGCAGQILRKLYNSCGYKSFPLI